MELNRSLQRTDEIRRRRTQQSRIEKRIPDRRKRKSVARTSPPVLVRNQLYGAAIPERQQAAKSRRRFDVRLDAQGTELHLRAIPKISIGWRFASFIVFSFFVFALYQIWTSPAYQVDDAEVRGLKVMSSTEINNTLGLNNDQVFTLDASIMQTELLNNFPEFKSVSVEIELPNTVAISVTERIPVLVWRQGEQALLLDADGLAYPERGGFALSVFPIVNAEGDPPPLTYSDPVTATLDSSVLELEEEAVIDEGDQSEAVPLLSPEMVSAYLLLAQKLPKGAQLIYNPEHGIGWLDRRDWNVFFGNAEDIETKLSIYNALLEHIKALEARPTLISVEYVHAPYYRLEP